MKRLLLNSLFIIFILILISCSNIRNKATTKINNKLTTAVMRSGSMDFKTPSIPCTTPPIERVSWPIETAVSTRDAT